MPLLASLRVLFSQLSPARRRAFLPLLALMLAGAVAEVATISAVVPLLSFIAAPADMPIDHAAADGMRELFGGWGRTASVYLLTSLFGIAAIASGVLRLTLLWRSSKFVYGVSYELGVKLYADTLLQTYPYHTQRNSSEIIASINKVQVVTMQVLVPIMQGTIAVVIGLFIIVGLVVIDPGIAIVAGVGFGLTYLAASITARKRLRLNSLIIANAQNKRVQTMQEGIGGIRDILLDRSQPVFVEMYERAEAGFRDARVRNAFLSGAPRFVVEAAGMAMIAVIAVVLVQRPGGLTAAIPVLGALALGAQRLLPLVQQAYTGWASAMGNTRVLTDVATLLRRPSPAQSEATPTLRFRDKITLHDVTYSYPSAKGPALKNVSLEIPRGSRVGIVGKTGTGKSTLMDLVLGLLEPSTGAICVDGVELTDANRTAWQQNIAHVPQAIFLTDASIAENIAFGVRSEDIDFGRVRAAAEQAELTEVIAALPQGYDTRVGERGIQLSGGQRQRVGIARALYKRANVLVFDEATSALDTETESAVMAAIERLDRDLTILVIAHRLSTLEGCDVIVRLHAGSAESATPNQADRGVSQPSRSARLRRNGQEA